MTDGTYQPLVYRKQGGDDLVVASGGEILVEDNGLLEFGDALDVSVKWDGTNLLILPLTDDTGAINFGNGTLDMDVKVFLSTAAKYVLFDVGGVLLTLEDVDLHLGDNDAIEFGDAAAGDVRAAWDGTNLVFLPKVDDTGVIHFGNGTLDIDVRVTLGAAADFVEADVGAKALEIAGDVRIDLSGATVAAGNTDGGVIKGGTSSARIVEDTADMKFVSLYFDCGAASGDARGIYNRLYITGAGGGGESLRSFTTVEDVAAATAHGAHVSLSLGASGSLTGQGIAVRATLHMPTTALPASNVTYAAIEAEVWSDGAASDPAGNKLSILLVGNNGDGTGAADVDDDCALLDFRGWTAGTGNMLHANAAATGNHSGSIKVRWPDGTVKYLYVWDAEA